MIEKIVLDLSLPTFHVEGNPEETHDFRRA
jgi:hypothetical protein